jgi:hypothetical protein
VIKNKKASSLPLSQWVMAVAMALVTVSVVGATLNATLVAVNQPQDVRSQAYEQEATGAGNVPIITAVKVAPVGSESAITADPTTSPGLLKAEIGSESKDMTEENMQASPRSSASAAIESLTGSNVTGVKFIYTLLGLGILIGGGAFGLIWVVQKVVGGQT